MNKYQPHILVLPEDRANEEIAIGFQLALSPYERSIQILRPAGGWPDVIANFTQIHVNEMRRYRNRYMVLMVDFDEQEDRLARVRQAIPTDLTERIVVLGVWSEPEDLKKQTNQTFEEIGVTLSQQCRDETATLWNHALLQHNRAERERLSDIFRPILFPLL